MYISNGMIRGGRIYTDTIEFKCPSCGYEWEAKCIVDEAINACDLVNDNNKYCPECGEKGE
jgi:uncharacterized Zn ribbon protein